MKLAFYCSLLLVGVCSYGQGSEFKLHENGLIYSDASIGKLKHIVDSLNLQFKACEIYKEFRALTQGKGHHFNLEGKKAAQAKEDLIAGMSYDDFREKYPKAVYDENLLIVKSDYIDYDGREMDYYQTPELQRDKSYKIDLVKSEKGHELGQWIFEYTDKTEYSDERLEAFYITSAFKARKLPQKYARLIQYSDCLVDTTAQVFVKNAKETGVRYRDSIPSKADAFNDYIEQVLKRPQFDYEKFETLLGFDTLDFEKPWKKAKLRKKERQAYEAKRKLVEAEYEVFSEKYEQWESQRLTRIDSLRNADPGFEFLLNAALNEAKITYASNDTFEEYVGRYVSAAEALELKRNRRVIGGCSMDNSPRIHAQNIAILSAETTKWEIFLRSHLDIMNDRFDRVSDGSWAYKDRQTYIRELEVLDINVPDLILGISLRVENPVENHYFGSIRRIGRALSETSANDLVETRMLDMIADDELDDFNRVLMYFLFDNYNYNLKDEIRKTANLEKLKKALSKMPDYVYARIDLKR